MSGIDGYMLAPVGPVEIEGEECFIQACQNPAGIQMVFTVPPWDFCLFSCWDHSEEAYRFNSQLVGCLTVLARGEREHA